MRKLEIKSNAYSEALQYRQEDLLHMTTRERTSLLFRKSQQYVRRKTENPRFEIWYSLVAPPDGAEKNLNVGAQLLPIILYKKPPKHFF